MLVSHVCVLKWKKCDEINYVWLNFYFSTSNFQISKFVIVKLNVIIRLFHVSVIVNCQPTTISWKWYIHKMYLIKVLKGLSRVIKHLPKSTTQKNRPFKTPSQILKYVYTLVFYFPLPPLGYIYIVLFYALTAGKILLILFHEINCH